METARLAQATELLLNGLYAGLYAPFPLDSCLFPTSSSLPSSLADDPVPRAAAGEQTRLSPCVTHIARPRSFGCRSGTVARDSLKVQPLRIAARAKPRWSSWSDAPLTRTRRARLTSFSFRLDPSHRRAHPCPRSP